MEKYHGYDQNGIARIWADSREEAELCAREYLAGRLDCQKITFRPLGKNGRPMLKGSFTVRRERLESDVIHFLRDQR